MVDDRAGLDPPLGVGPVARLSDADVEQTLTRLEDLLVRLEEMPGVGGEVALDAIATLTAIYGEALARVMARLSPSPELAADLASDELLGHLFVLHGISPTPLEERIAQAVDALASYLPDAKLHLTGVADLRAHVELSGRLHSCSTSAADVKDAVVAAVLAAAPELAQVDVVVTPDVPEPALIPAESLFRASRVPS